MSGFAIAGLRTHTARVSAKTAWIFVRAVDRDGVTGWGEATLPAGGADGAIDDAVTALAHELSGRVLRAPPDLAPPVPGADLAAAAAFSAVDQALWDIAGRREGRPIARLLAPAPAERVSLYANVNRRTLDRTPSGFAASARDARDAGHFAFKIAPFDGVSPANADGADGGRLIVAGIERAAAVRAAIGDEARLMIDCHWRLSEESALAVIAEAASLRLHWLECAVPESPDSFAAMRRIRARANAAGILTAGCETMTGVEGFRPFLDAGAYDVVMPDVKYAGGLAEFLRIAELAAAHGVACSPHNPSGPICHAQSLHATAALPGAPMLEHQFDESPLFAALVADAAGDFVAPVVDVPVGPGLGVRLDEAALGAAS